MSCDVLLACYLRTGVRVRLTLFWGKCNRELNLAGSRLSDEGSNATDVKVNERRLIKDYRRETQFSITTRNKSMTASRISFSVVVCKSNSVNRNQLNLFIRTR